MTESATQADIQRAEAKRRMRAMFKISEGQSNGTIERIVDCIISAAVLETASLMAIAAQEPKT